MLPVVMQILAQSGSSDSGATILGLLPLVVIGGLFYVMMIRPQKRRARASRALRDSVSVGDEIRTVGGILGRIVAVDDEEIRLEVAPGLTIRLTRRAIGERLDGNDE